MRKLRASELLFGKGTKHQIESDLRFLLVDKDGCEVNGTIKIDELSKQAHVGRQADFSAFRVLLLQDTRNDAENYSIFRGARIFRASDAKVQRGDISDLVSAVTQHGPFDVIIFCTDLPNNLSPEFHYNLERIARESVVVARISARYVVDCRHYYSSEDLYLSVRTPEGGFGQISLQEASPVLVGSLAGSWIHQRRKIGLVASPPEIRAILLASRFQIDRSSRALGAVSTGMSLPKTWSLDLVEGACSFQTNTSSTGNVAIVIDGPDGYPFWFCGLTSLSIDRGQIVHTGDGEMVATIKNSQFITVHVAPSPPSAYIRVTFASFEIQGKPIKNKTTSAHRPLTIVGIAASHDGSACIIRDGKLISAIQLERLTRRKHDGQGFLSTSKAVDYCLASAGLTRRDVDIFAFNSQPLSPESVGLGLPSHDADFDLFSPFEDRAVFVSHHLSHAFGAYFGCGQRDATVIVCDGTGGTTVGRTDLILRGTELAEYLIINQTRAERLLENMHVFSAYSFSQSGWKLLERELGRRFNTLSGCGQLGETYASVSEYVFGSWQDSGKLMGLAPYGDPESLGPSLLEPDEDGLLQFGRNWRNSHRRALHRVDPLEYKDLAARIQRDLEEALLQRFRRILSRTEEKHVAYAGGVALNSVANQRLREETGAKSLYVMPASSDAGTSIGAAVAAHYLETNKMPSTDLRTDAFGHIYSSRDIDNALSQFENLVNIQEVDLAEIAKRLYHRQIVGWFNGRSEFGPRSLGQRSILASPVDHEMRAYINRRIKYREDFRPFAPMVIEELANEYFEIDEPSPFMLRIVKVREAYRHLLGAITHVDGSARVQTVSRSDSPLIHELLQIFCSLSGVPVLVNTSFNVRGEPIVETPVHALEMLLATHLDAVVFDGRRCVTPIKISQGRIEDEHYLELPPKCRLSAQVERGVRSYSIIAEARGFKEYPIPAWAFTLISELTSGSSVGEELSSLGNPRREEARSLLESLLSLRLLAVRASAPKPEILQNPSDLRSTHTDTLSHGSVLPYGDETFLLGGQRVLPKRITIEAASKKLTQMGVTRIADVTNYDYLGIHVVSCIRPFVNHTDISCTQGKGMQLEDAVASALMETVERFSAWQNNHIPRKIASIDELRKKGEMYLSPGSLGAKSVPEGPIEWVWGKGIFGHPRWIPAGAVFAPYFSPPTMISPFGWNTTGLSAGNTLSEAIAHGALEVIERDALSRYLDGCPGKVLDLHTIPVGPERELFERFKSADIDVFVVDMSEIAGLPMFSVSLYDKHGPEPRIPVSGQGCNPSPGVALRRAALEAAQSRVVVIQGSREDLIRHGTEWTDDEAERQRYWEQSRAAAQRGGISQFESEPAAAATIVEFLNQIRLPLLRVGMKEILYCDLTHPEIHIPVVRVIIPGMFDGDSDPGIRRRWIS